MSFLDKAALLVLDTAGKFLDESDSCGMLRSVDATEASRWLEDIALDMIASVPEHCPVPQVAAKRSALVTRLSKSALRQTKFERLERQGGQ